MSTSSIKRRIWRFHVVVVQWTSKKCTKKRDAHAEQLFCSSLLKVPSLPDGTPSLAFACYSPAITLLLFFFCHVFFV